MKKHKDITRPDFPARRKESKGRVRYLKYDPLTGVDEEKIILDYFTLAGCRDTLDTVITLLDTGLRPSELWHLQRRDVNITGEILTILGRDDKGTKNGEFRSVPMTTRVVAIVKRRFYSQGDYLFPYNNGWMRRKWNPMKAALGYEDDKEFVPYCLRHTCATRVLQRTNNIVMVKEWLGHKDLQTTLRYAHLDPSSLNVARDALNGYSEPNKPPQRQDEPSAEELLEALQEKLGLSKEDLIKAVQSK